MQIDSPRSTFVMVGREGIEPPKGVTHLIYSQLPLAAWIPAHSIVKRSGSLSRETFASRRPESNRQPSTYKVDALPIELRRLVCPQAIRSPDSATARRKHAYFPALRSTSIGCEGPKVKYRPLSRAKIHAFASWPPLIRSRYPIPGSVMIHLGRAGAGSSFWRR